MPQQTHQQKFVVLKRAIEHFFDDPDISIEFIKAKSEECANLNQRICEIGLQWGEHFITIDFYTTHECQQITLEEHNLIAAFKHWINTDHLISGRYDAIYHSNNSLAFRQV